MSHTSKSPRRVILAALAIGRDALPDYSHRFSPTAFTQPQLFACLVLKTFLKLDYRGAEAFLVDSPDLVALLGGWLGLRVLPKPRHRETNEVKIFVFDDHGAGDSGVPSAPATRGIKSRHRFSPVRS